MTNTIPLVVADPERDVIEQLAVALEASVDRDGWDQPARLFWFTRGDGPAGFSVLFATEGPSVPLNVHPVQFCQALAEHLMNEALRGAGTPEYWARLASWRGLGLIIEAWSVPEPTDPEGKVKARQEAGARRLRLRADRIETRCCLVVMADGRQRTVERLRGQEPTASHMSGAVLDELRLLLGAAQISSTVALSLASRP